MTIFDFNSREDKYEEVNDVESLRAVRQMIQRIVPWSFAQNYYVVKVHRPGTVDGFQFYPLPLVYASKEEQEAEAKRRGKDVPDEDSLKRVRNKIAALICDGPLRARKMEKWIIPSEYRRMVSNLAGQPINYNEGDEYIEQILRHRGEDVLLDIIEEAGYCLAPDDAAEFAISFTEKDLGVWNAYDKTGHEETCLHFAAYCCAMRAPNYEAHAEIQSQAVREFIFRLRSWLDEINAEE